MSLLKYRYNNPKKFFQFLIKNWPVWFLLALSLSKYIALGNGLVLGEPDEYTHARVAASFAQGWVPKDGKNVWFYELPGYPFLAYLVNFFTHDYYIALRIVSASAALLATLGIYWLGQIIFEEGKHHRASLADFGQRDERFAYKSFITALLYTLSPLVVFYARVGMLDSSLVAFSFLFLFNLQASIKKKSLWLGALSGIFLGIALLVKYSALIYVGLLGLVFIICSWRATFSGFGAWRSWGDLKKNFAFLEFLKLDTVTTLSLFVGGLLAGPVAFAYWRFDSWHFKQHLYTNLGFITDFWRNAGSSLSIFSYLGSWGWWLGLPIGILFLLGILPALRDYKRWGVLLGGLLLTLFVLVRQKPFYPRYFLMVVPYVAVIGAYGFELLWELLSWYWSLVRKDLTLKWNTRSYFELLILLAILLAVPCAEAWHSSQHRLIENASAYISQNADQENPWVFTNYWPNFFSAAVPTDCATWLSDSPWETTAFIPQESRSALTILDREGGWVVLENLYSYSKMFISPPARANAWQKIRDQYEPVAVMEDHSPNFPHFKTSLNKAGVYQIISAQSSGIGQ